MRKLTLKQALKTPNIAFDVTSEQLNWINKYNSSKVSDRAIAIIVNPNLTLGCLEYKNDWYSENFLPILVEIVEEELNTFNSQQEVWQWLAEGNKCLWKRDNTITFIIGFKDGTLYNFTSNQQVDYLEVSYYKEWTKYKEPEYIIVNGFQVPKPLTSLKGLSVVYIPEISYECFYDEISAYLDCTKRYLKRNILHATKEAAITHAKAMLGYQA